LFAGTDVPEDGVPIEELVEASGKLAVLDRILRRLKDAGHRVVLFSQFTSMLDILSDFLTLRGYQARSIHWFPYDRVRVVNADP
jgi:SNF2 family DNA or RNA helicase